MRRSEPAVLPRAGRVGVRRSPLEGLRVVDFSHFIAGPVYTMILADLGADVIKIENAVVNGDALRTFHPQVQGESAAFLWANRTHHRPRDCRYLWEAGRKAE